MSYRLHVLMFGSLGVLFGLAELIAPAMVLEAFGLPADPGAWR